MTAEPAIKIKPATYEDLYTIPDNMVGEIIDGELITTPRPSARHTFAGSVLGAEIMPPYQFGRGGPSGWIILDETEIMLGENLMVPDLAGWRKERFPGLPEKNWIPVAPDWVCEVLSPSTHRLDKARKMPIYARYGVSHIWLIDPANKSLDVYKNASGTWALAAAYFEDDKVRAEPFGEIEIALTNLWIE